MILKEYWINMKNLSVPRTEFKNRHSLSSLSDILYAVQWRFAILDFDCADKFYNDSRYLEWKILKTLTDSIDRSNNDSQIQNVQRGEFQRYHISGDPQNANFPRIYADL